MNFLKWFLVTLALLTVIVAITVLVMILIQNGSDEKNGDEEREELFQLSIIHINDFHARFEETNEQSLPCLEGQNCVGGFARMKTVVDDLKLKRPNAIFLNAGDNFQGTFWFNLLRYNVTSHFLNLMPADAITLGNHEFAHRVPGVVSFLKLLESPVVVANIDDRHEPTLQKLYQKSIIIERSGRKIGVIGVILKETSEIASTDKLKFTSEVEAIRNEATKLRTNNVNIIVVLSHCGLDRDREIALEAGEFVDVIIGGHSHSFLYTARDAGSYPGLESPVGSYPIVITPRSGSERKVLIVQASAFTKFVGDLTVYFNSAGHVKFYEGNPVYLSNDVEKDPEIERMLIPWREEVNRLGQRVVGYSNVNLLNEGCRHGECVLGSFTADAFVHETQRAFPELSVFAAVIQAAGMRNSFQQGNISYGDVVSFMPFENTLDVLHLRGDILFEMFEHSVSRSFVPNDFIGVNFLQVSGFQLTYNVTKPVGQRLQTIQIKTNNSGTLENINPHTIYAVVVPSFIASGGDGFTMLKINRMNQRTGLLDVDLLEKFISHNSPIQHELDERILMLT